MSDPTSTEALNSLSRLHIDKAQRPTASRRGWVVLAAALVIVGALAAGAAYWYYRTTGLTIAAALAEKSVDVNVTIVPGSATKTDEIVMVANGKIVSDHLVNVATKVSGQIVELNVEQGDQVAQDRVLARLEDVVYRAQRDEAAARTAQAEHAVARATAEETRARAAIEQARADNEFRQRDFQRIKSLYDYGQASELEYLNAKNFADSAHAAVDVAMAAADAASADLAAERTDVEASRAVLRVWQKRLDDCEIRAPIAGVILERNAEVGDFLAAEGGRGANANAQLVSIADPTRMRVEVDVSERDIGKISAEQRARITPDADRHVYNGHVMWVDPVGDYARAIVQVKVRIEEPGPSIRVDGSAKVEFLVRGVPAADGNATALWLPKVAVQLTPGSDEGLVFTLAGGRAVPHRVQVGTRTDKSVQIRSGVQPGMELICDNVDNMKDGTPVRVVRTVAFGEL